MSLQLIGSGLDGVWKEKKVVQAKVDQLDKEKKAINLVIDSLEEESKAISVDRQKVYDRIRELRKQLDQGVCNSTFGILHPFFFLL